MLKNRLKRLSLLGAWLLLAAAVSACDTQPNTPPNTPVVEATATIAIPASPTPASAAPASPTAALPEAVGTSAAPSAVETGVPDAVITTEPQVTPAP